MREIAYRQWGLIPLDDAPEQMAPTTFNPPMLTNLAFDGGASLVFELASAPAQLHMSVQLTAASAPSETSFLQLFCGESYAALRRLPGADWELHYDGPVALLGAPIEAPAALLKLHHAGAQTLIVTGVRFSAA